MGGGPKASRRTTVSEGGPDGGSARHTGRTRDFGQKRGVDRTGGRSDSDTCVSCSRHFRSWLRRHLQRPLTPLVNGRKGRTTESLRPPLLLAGPTSSRGPVAEPTPPTLPRSMGCGAKEDTVPIGRTCGGVGGGGAGGRVVKCTEKDIHLGHFLHHQLDRWTTQVIHDHLCLSAPVPPRETHSRHPHFRTKRKVGPKP